MQSGSRQMQGQGDDKHTIDSDDEVNSANHAGVYIMQNIVAVGDN